MLKDMFNKKMMEKIQGQMEETKSKLNNITLIGEAENGNIKVVANGNRMLSSIELNKEFYASASKEDIANLILTAANRALEQAERVEKSEMSHAAMGMMPGLGK
jgi:nucleoid-associated protein EbfC